MDSQFFLFLLWQKTINLSENSRSGNFVKMNHSKNSRIFDSPLLKTKENQRFSGVFRAVKCHKALKYFFTNFSYQKNPENLTIFPFF